LEIDALNVEDVEVIKGLLLWSTEMRLLLELSRLTITIYQQNIHFREAGKSFVSID
jgi:hypothetical protein